MPVLNDYSYQYDKASKDLADKLKARMVTEGVNRYRFGYLTPKNEERMAISGFDLIRVYDLQMRHLNKIGLFRYSTPGRQGGDQSFSRSHNTGHKKGGNK